MADSWPPAETVRWRGYRLRYTAGVTRRANSVLAAMFPTGLIEATSLIERVESFYADRRAAPLFQVSDAAAVGLSNTLAQRGYEPVAETVVLVADLERLRSGVGENGGTAKWPISVDNHCTDAWFATYWSVEADRGRSDDDKVVLRDVLLAPALDTRFVAAQGNERVAAVGQVVVDGDLACGQCLATAPVTRRQGAGAAVLRSLVSQAGELGARHFTVAVQADNEASLELCRSVGFDESHRYRYFVVQAS